MIDAPVPRRGRPQRDPQAAEADRAVTATGIDVERLAWSPDGARIAVDGPATTRRTSRRVADRARRRRDRRPSRSSPGERQPRHRRHAGCPTGRSSTCRDADGWFQVVRRSPDGRDRIVLTDGEREHGEPSRRVRATSRCRRRTAAASSTSRSTTGSSTWSSVERRRRRRAEARPRPAARRRREPWPPRRPGRAHRAVGRRVAGGRLAGRRRLGRRDRRERDAAAGPVAAARPGRGARRTRARARSPTRARPCSAGAWPPAGSPAGERFAFTARDGLRIEGTLWRPAGATGKRGGRRVPDDHLPARRPDLAGVPRVRSRSSCCWSREGYAFLDVDFRGSTGYGRAFRQANHDEWGHADVHDVIDGGRWAAEQPWSDGRLAIYGGSYGGYIVLCALVEEPAMWSAGVDLFGDSEIAESFRHGDRPGRLDLHRMMGTPDDPARTARRSAAARRSTAPSASRRPLLHPPRPQGQARRPAHDRADGRGARDRGQDLRGPLVRRGGPRLGARARTGATPSSRILAFLKTHVPPVDEIQGLADRQAPGPTASSG